MFGTKHIARNLLFVGLFKNTFLIKIVGKIVNMCLIVKQRHIKSIGNEKIDIACFRKVPKKPIILTHFLFHRTGYFGTTDSVDLNVAFFDIKFSETPNFLVKKTNFVHKYDEDGDIKSRMRWSLNEIVVESSR